MKSDLPPDLQAALRRFPRLVREKRLRYRRRQAFLRKTFGKLVRELRRDEARGRH